MERAAAASVTAVIYQLDRTNVRLPDPNNPGFFILSGSNRIRGFETNLTGYVTPDWRPLSATLTPMPG